MAERIHPTRTAGADAARAEAAAELWDAAAGVLTRVSIVLLLAFLVVVLAAHATAHPVLEVVAVVLAAWAALTLAALHAVDTRCRSLPWRLLRRPRNGGERR